MLLQRGQAGEQQDAARAFVETMHGQHPAEPFLQQRPPLRRFVPIREEADAGGFARDKDVAALARKWKVNAG